MSNGGCKEKVLLGASGGEANGAGESGIEGVDGIGISSLDSTASTFTFGTATLPLIPQTSVAISEMSIFSSLPLAPLAFF
ncbi:hypothetical protein LOK49_LG14G00963 [Camellia lanceoleosa]|uniref:Uncharacterized protein n=1 Tax=Camellia lanceoleosa TaxID=1840588 RepID=A0ACC0FCB5_9ERIC|nr:hypothetical protein LOK49_LG14G00963 [Camellia lanceoleosa]